MEVCFILNGMLAMVLSSNMYTCNGIQCDKDMKTKTFKELLLFQRCMRVCFITDTASSKEVSCSKFFFVLMLITK